jgi:hypothetical protein
MTSKGTTIISTGYFTSGNEPHEIVNATHNTFTKKLDMQFKYIFSFFLEMLHFQFRRAQSLIKYPVYINNIKELIIIIQSAQKCGSKFFNWSRKMTLFYRDLFYA